MKNPIDMWLICFSCRVKNILVRVDLSPVMVDGVYTFADAQPIVNEAIQRRHKECSPTCQSVDLMGTVVEEYPGGVPDSEVDKLEEQKNQFWRRLREAEEQRTIDKVNRKLEERNG